MKYILLLLPLLCSCIFTEQKVDNHSIVLQEGYLQIHEEDRFQETSVEYRFPHYNDLSLRPVIGLTHAGDDGNRAITPYIAARYDLDVGANWTLGPSLGLAYYDRHDESLPDLGGDWQFRLSIDFTRRITDHVSIGVGLNHLSNGNILHDKNTGADSVVFVLEWHL